MLSYENVGGGKLKLKGKALDVKAAGMKKKKKHKKHQDQTSLVTKNELSADNPYLISACVPTDFSSMLGYLLLQSSIYNNVRHPSKLANGTDFLCFKFKIEPKSKWGDPVCANGGKWTVTFPRGKSDTSWLYTLLAMIGEQFDHGNEICGAVVNVSKSQEKISIWTKNAINEAAQDS